MYKSPIEIVQGQMQTQIENEILRAVQSVGVNVDKDELTRALEYDRGQYEKGFQDGVESVQRWISVEDRQPDLIPCNAGTAYSEAVNVLTTGRKVLTAIWDGCDFIADAEFWGAEGEKITHWAPVLLPLPEKPKES